MVVVTHNRRQLLAASLEAIFGQSRLPDRVHVIDNASDDGTADMVTDRFPTTSLNRLTSNTGGAGGFAAGLAFALDDGADLVWLMDDDTVPAPNALAELLEARSRYGPGVPALMASRVQWTDGRYHPMNTPR